MSRDPMLVRDIQVIMEEWAPKSIASENDNPGLQIGSLDQRIKKVLVTLDVRKGIIEEAHAKKADLIISHHPIFYQPIKSVTTDEQKGQITAMCLKYGISVYSAHTNLDFATNGVSYALAEKIGLTDVKILFQEKKNQKKVIVFVPPDFVDHVRKAMMEAGAGLIGNYEFCSFETDGFGTFKPNEKANPTIGKAKRINRIKEVKLEVIAPDWKIDSVLKAMRQAHPYEEIAYDVYDLANITGEIGAGAIGSLERALKPGEFLSHIAHKLFLPAVRFQNHHHKEIKRVAVCGGSGSHLIPSAVLQGADAFITGDISYHRFEETAADILLVDAGHYETEYPVIPKIIYHLKKQMIRRKAMVTIIESQIGKNNVHYFIPKRK